MTLSSLTARLPAESVTLLSCLQTRGPLTKGDLVALTGMKLTTLNRFLLPLTEQALITGTGVAESTGGRKPAFFDIRSDAAFTCGIDFARLQTTVVIADLKLKPRYRVVLPMTSESTPETAFREARRLLDEGLELLGLTQDSLSGIGISLVSRLHPESGKLDRAPFFRASGWTETCIRDLITRWFSCWPVVADNGANAAVLLESSFVPERSGTRVAYVNCGVCIRSAMSSGKQIVTATEGSDDAFGHMVVRMDGTACHCGNRGCIESYASIHAMETAYATAVGNGSEGDAASGSFADIAAAAATSGGLSRRVIRDAAQALGVGLANFVNLIAPDWVVLGGTTIRHSDYFAEEAVRTARRHCYRKPGVDFVCQSPFGDDAMALGAAALLCHQLFTPGQVVCPEDMV